MPLCSSRGWPPRGKEPTRVEVTGVRRLCLLAAASLVLGGVPAVGDESQENWVTIRATVVESGPMWIGLEGLFDVVSRSLVVGVGYALPSMPGIVGFYPERLDGDAAWGELVLPTGTVELRPKVERESGGTLRASMTLSVGSVVAAGSPVALAVMASGGDLSSVRTGMSDNVSIDSVTTGAGAAAMEVDGDDRGLAVAHGPIAAGALYEQVAAEQPLIGGFTEDASCYKACTMTSRAPDGRTRLGVVDRPSVRTGNFHFAGPPGEYELAWTGTAWPAMSQPVLFDPDTPPAFAAYMPAPDVWDLFTGSSSSAPPGWPG